MSTKCNYVIFLKMRALSGLRNESKSHPLWGQLLLSCPVSRGSRQSGEVAEQKRFEHPVELPVAPAFFQPLGNLKVDR